MQTGRSPWSRRTFLFGAAPVVAIVAWTLGARIQHRVTLWAALRSDTVDDELVAALANAADHPLGITERFWTTGKIPHRQAAVRYLQQACADGMVRLDDAQGILLQAANDGDLSVVELSLGILAAGRHPGLKPVAVQQLENRDPEARSMALRALRRVRDPDLIPVVVGMLDDPSPSVVAAGAAVLRELTGQDFGVRQWMTTAESGDRGKPDEGAARLREGVQQWKAWWASRAPAQEVPPPVRRLPPPVPIGAAVADFSLESPDGENVRLKDFRGRVVVLHFWATWCTACLPEIPILNTLQAESDGRFVLLAVALDGATESHGHGHQEEGDGTAAADAASPSEQVKAILKERGIRYPVAIDPENRVGRRFSGGELPTTVLIDEEGRIRRRFVGGRPTRVWRELLTELTSLAPSY